MHHWLVPANIKFYDVFAAFEQSHTFWPMNTKIEPGDIILVYLAAPHKQIGFVCQVLETGIEPSTVLDELRRFMKGEITDKGPDKPFMKLQTTAVISLSDDSPLSLARLKQNGLNGMLMGVRKLENNPQLLAYIKGNLP